MFDCNDLFVCMCESNIILYLLSNIVKNEKIYHLLSFYLPHKIGSKSTNQNYYSPFIPMLNFNLIAPNCSQRFKISKYNISNVNFM